MSPKKNKLKVLVVDDEAGFRNLLKWELESLDIQVETAADGAEGLQRAAETPFDVIITDITMPEMDGLKLLEKIKKIAPNTEVIIVTGFGAVETAVHAMKNGAFDFVLKPYDMEHLKQKVWQSVDSLARCRECGRPAHE
jgi:DNA-binding NtrC family response regulator